MENSHKDSRDILRGSCTVCACAAYVRGSGMPCQTCKHPPAKHRRVDGGEKPTHGGTSLGPCTTIPTERHSRATAAEGYGSSSYSHPPRDLPECAASGCKHPVYYDPILGPFDYCRPKCRDEHLLPTYNKQLKEDIEQFEHTYCSSTAISHSQPKHPSSKLSSVKLDIMTKPKEHLGFEYCKHCTDKVVIVGVYRTRMDMLADGTICFLDRISKVFDTNVGSIQKLKNQVYPKTHIELTIDRSDALTWDMNQFVDSARRYRSTKIVCVKYDEKYEDYGLTVTTTKTHKHQPMLIVSGCSKYSPAYSSGIKVNDEIKVYASADKSGYGTVYTDTDLDYKVRRQYIEAAYKNKCYLIFGINE